MFDDIGHHHDDSIKWAQAEDDDNFSRAPRHSLRPIVVTILILGLLSSVYTCPLGLLLCLYLWRRRNRKRLKP